MSPRNEWPEEAIALFRRLCENEASSYSDIAAQMSEQLGVRFTKNACIGKARRLDMPMRKAPDKPRKNAPEPMFHPKPLVWALANNRPQAKPQRGQVTLMELNRTTCRYPFGDRPPYWFCGQVVREAQSYCAHHCDVAYGRTWGGSKRDGR